jgi:hypothetical protein
MNIRAYNAETDKEQAFRVWFEIGWVDKDDNEKLYPYLEAGNTWVAEIRDEVECLVMTYPGTMRWMTEDLPLGAVMAVTVSRVARKQGLASRVTAHAIADDVINRGALLSGLGMFEQGFYNNLGFGSGGYEHHISFDPMLLQVSGRPRPPRRLTKDDADAIHQARLNRHHTHGTVNLLPVASTRADCHWDEGFGLGYFDNADGSLSHHLWIGAKERGPGPYDVWWMQWNTPEQFRELMQVLKSLEDQVRLIQMREQAGIQMQDFVKIPLRQRSVTRHTKWEANVSAVAYWQVRMNDLAECLAKTHLDAPTLRFNLEITDPIERYLDANSEWRGVGGEYIITLGAESEARRGSHPNLPTLKTTVNAFTRLWFGVRPASGLALSDELNAPPELLDALDRTLLLPQPLPDWDY